MRSWYSRWKFGSPSRNRMRSVRISACVHLVDRLGAGMRGELRPTEVGLHLRVQEVLVDRCEPGAQSVVEHLDNPLVSTHATLGRTGPLVHRGEPSFRAREVSDAPAGSAGGRGRSAVRSWSSIRSRQLPHPVPARWPAHVDDVCRPRCRPPRSSRSRRRPHRAVHVERPHRDPDQVMVRLTYRRADP